MTDLTTKHQRLAALRPLSPESVASLAAAWDVRMVTGSGQNARATGGPGILPAANNYFSLTPPNDHSPLFS